MTMSLPLSASLGRFSSRDMDRLNHASEVLAALHASIMQINIAGKGAMAQLVYEANQEILAVLQKPTGQHGDAGSSATAKSRKSSMSSEPLPKAFNYLYSTGGARAGRGLLFAIFLRPEDAATIPPKYFCPGCRGPDNAAVHQGLKSTIGGAVLRHQLAQRSRRRCAALIARCERLGSGHPRRARYQRQIQAKRAWRRP